MNCKEGNGNVLNMCYSKFVILYTSNFCSRINDFYCVEEWVSHNYDVEYWDLSAFTCHEHLADYNVEGLKNRVVSSLKEFKDLVSKNNNATTLYMTWVNYCWYSAGFYDALSEYNCNYAFFDNGLIPNFDLPSDASSVICKMIKKMRRISYTKIKNLIMSKYRDRKINTNHLNPAKFYFKLSETYLGVDKMDGETIVGWCNSGDYERNKRLKEIKETNYIVFLDQYIPYHNDNVLMGLKQINSCEYYSSLNRCFSLLEEKYKMPIVVAAHPAALKYKENNPFDGRKIIFNKTAELVKQSEFVIAHYTTAISFVVLNNKRILFLSSDSIKKLRPNIDYYICRFSELLGAKLLNQDTATYSDLEIEEVDIQKYNDYKYKYLTNRYSESKSNFDNIIKVINC